VRASYPERVALVALRQRLPFIAFVVIALVCLVLLGFICACLSDHPAQALERALTAAASSPALIEVWASLMAALVATWAVGTSQAPRARAPSVASLQRFLL
jgi:hypothetical protein